jgi:hypothetical protein
MVGKRIMAEMEAHLSSRPFSSRTRQGFPGYLRYFLGWCEKRGEVPSDARVRHRRMVRGMDQVR